MNDAVIASYSCLDILFETGNEKRSVHYVVRIRCSQLCHRIRIRYIFWQKFTFYSITRLLMLTTDDRKDIDYCRNWKLLNELRISLLLSYSQLLVSNFLFHFSISPLGNNFMNVHQRKYTYCSLLLPSHFLLPYIQGTSFFSMYSNLRTLEVPSKECPCHAMFKITLTS